LLSLRKFAQCIANRTKHLGSMSVIDLSTRITGDWDIYHAYKKSSDSFIYVVPNTFILDDGPASIDFTVGERWFLENDQTAYDVGDGIVLNPSQAVLIETAEKLAVPYNVFGLVTGKGSKIFQGAFISTGKINPGFNDNLKIGIYNGSKKRIKLMKNIPLCTCVFFEMESNLKNPPNESRNSGSGVIRPISRWRRFTIWIKENKEWLSVIVSIFALLISLFIGIANRNFIFYSDVKNGGAQIQKHK